MIQVLSSAIFGVLLIFFFLAPDQRDFFAETFAQRFSLGATASNVERRGLTAEAINIFRTHPVFGIGAENFGGYLMMGYSNMSYVRSIEINNLTPHNFFLQVAAEQGMIGIAGLVLWLTGVSGVLYTSPRKASQDSKAQLYRFGLQLVLRALLTQLALGYMAGGFRIILGIYLGLVLTLTKLDCFDNSANVNSHLGVRQYEF